MSLSVRGDRAAPCAVRAWLTALDHLGWANGDAMLVASELVTNAVLQMGDVADWIEVNVSQRADHVIIAVSDPGPEADDRSDLEASDGVGRVLVEALTRRWGIEPGRPHTVWAEI